MAEGESFVIKAKEVQDGRMDVVRVRFFFGGAQPHGICGADYLPALCPAASEPHGKAVRIMIAAILTFAHRHPTKFTAPNDKGQVEQPARLQIFEKPRDLEVALGAKFGMIAFHVGMAVPAVSIPAIKLHEADPAL